MKNKYHLFLFANVITILSSLILINTSGIVDYKPYYLDSSPKELVWCGPARETVILLTELNSVLKSEDKGFSWKKMNEIFTSTGKDQLEDNENELGKVSRIIQSPVDKSLLIFLGTHGINWVSENCGKSIKALNHGRKIKEFVFHPTERTWGLASAYTLCEDFIGEPCKIYKELFVTKDLGLNWDVLGAYIVQFGWGVYDESHIAKGIPKERILVTYEPRGRGNQKIAGWNYKVDFIYSDDFFKTKKIGAHKGNKFLLTKVFLFVAQVADQESQEVLLLGASSYAKTYLFSPIETNQKSYREHSYTFLDSSENSVFLHINHFGDVSRYGHVYMSDSQGLKYSLSLKYNVRSLEGECEFDKIHSLEGVYIANVISWKFMKLAEQEMEEEEITDTDSMGDVAHKAKNNEKRATYKNYITTLITFNQGGDWKRIQAPARDSLGKAYECKENCYLNLFGLASEYPQFYSVESAAGIILGNGNVGSFLDNETGIATFLSRDGGLTWSEIRKGSHIYEIGDHGAIIILADQTPTDSVIYSWDEGLTWQDLIIAKDKILIKNITIEPSATSQHFILYGEHFKSGVKNGVVIGLDFSSLHEPQCRNPDNPNTEDSDYEKWTPNEGRSGKECLMGKKVTYIRRKREAQCYNGLTFERKILTEYCSCTEDDYECDMGYGRLIPGEPCIKFGDLSHEEEVQKPQEDCMGYYSITRGYRKIPGNACIHGEMFDPILVPCPFPQMFTSLGILFVITIIFTIIALAMLAWSKYYESFEIIIPKKIKRKTEEDDNDTVSDEENILNVNLDQNNKNEVEEALNVDQKGR